MWRGVGVGMLVVATTALGACTSDPTLLVVDLRTDLVPGVEFSVVETSVESTPGTPAVFAAELDDDFPTGLRVAELSGLPEGDARIRVRLLQGGAVVAERPATVSVKGQVGITIVITRDCRGVVCPTTGDPTATACLGGTCVDPRCTAETPEACMAECSVDGDCPGGAACAEARCAGGACLLGSRAGACASAQYCDPDVGCVDVVPVADAGMDASAPDAGSDAGQPPDAGTTDAAGWWDLAWSRRRVLRLDNSASATELVEFPVLVALDDTRIDYTSVLPGGSDLRFVDPVTLDVLPHEVEAWTRGGPSTIWVRAARIPAMSSASTIHMYYGNAAAGDVADPSRLWGQYDAVWHMRDASDGSGNGFDATNVGAVPVASALGGAHVFDGNDDWFDLGRDLELLRNVGQVTLSAVVEPAAFGSSEPHIIGIGRGGFSPSTASRAALAVTDSAEVRALARAADSDLFTALDSPAVLSTGRRYHLATVIDYAAARIVIYRDGAELVSGPTSRFTRATTSDTAASSAAIGAEDDGSEDFFEGTIDEVRVAPTARGPDWIRAQNQTLRDAAFVLYGPEQLAP